MARTGFWRNIWEAFNDSDKASLPYAGRLTLHYFLVFLSPFFVIFIVGLLMPVWALGDTVLILDKLYRQRSKAFLAVLLRSPFVVLPVVSLALGLGGYLTNTGQPRTYYLFGGEYFRPPPLETYNIDPIVRRQSIGCIFNAIPLGFLTVLPHNGVLSGMSLVFGPMRGTYRGAYPDEQTARDWLTKHGQDWTREQLLAPGWQLTGASKKITGAQILELIDHKPDDIKHIRYEQVDRMKLVLYRPECLLIGYKTKATLLIELVDVDNKQVFARYPLWLHEIGDLGDKW